MKKHITSICVKSFALTAALAFALAGPTSRAADPDSNASSSTAQTFRVGLDATYPPMEFKDKDGTLVGFDIDMDKEIAKRLGTTFVPVEINFDGIWLALNSGKFDAAVSACSITQKRLQNYLFTKPYIANQQVIVAKKDTAPKIAKLDDLAGMVVGVQAGTTAEFACQDYLKKNPGKFTLKSYPGATQPFDDLTLDRVQAIVIDQVVGDYYVNTMNKGFAFAPAAFQYEPIGIVFRKSDTAFRDKVDKILDDMRADGTMQKISQKWFNEDLVSNVKAEYPTGPASGD